MDSINTVIIIMMMIVASKNNDQILTGHRFQHIYIIAMSWSKPRNRRSTFYSFLIKPLFCYCLSRYLDIGGYELVLMHNPWFHPNYTWTGKWSDGSKDCETEINGGDPLNK